MREDIADNSVDLIYLDPPYNSKRIYNTFYGGAQWVAFDDTWRWHEAIEDYHEIAKQSKYAGLMDGLKQILGESSELAYLSYMTNRLVECARILKSTGTIYLHCDPTMSHYLKVVMDNIFGKNQFRKSGNEIIWFYHDTPGRPKTAFARKHDVIFRYTASDTWRFNADDVRVPILEASKQRYQTPRVLGGRSYVGGESAKKGKIPEDVWQIPAVKRNSKESQKMETQKPLRLLHRIILASSNKGDLVLDPFCGCGTTIRAAQDLGRRWIGIDICVKACQTIEKRLAQDIRVANNRYDVVGFPKTVSQAKTLADIDKFKFEKWAASLVDGMEANKKQRSDKGIDGRGRIAIRKGEFVDMVSQVKGGNTGPSDIQAFNGARKESGAEFGIFTCFEDKVTSRMKESAANAGKFMDIPVIQIYTIEDFFERRIPQLPLPRITGN